MAEDSKSAVSVREKVGYGLGDTASNVVFQVAVNYLMIFYTDVFGITAAAVGTMMLAVRIFDAVTDPLMGGIADRTRSRWGSYRPYLLFACIPYAVLAVLAFTTPDISDKGKLVYAYITYALLMACYTVINIPYSALGGVLSEDPKERASIQSYRFALAMVGGTLVTGAMLPLADMIGGENRQFGFQMAMGVFALFSVVCFLICFFWTKERIPPRHDAQATSIFKDFFGLRHNDQWVLIAATTMVLLTLIAMRGSVTPYYVTYYLNKPDLVSLFISASMVAGFLGAISTNFLSRYFCKLTLFKFSLWSIVVFHGLLFMVGRGSFQLAFTLFCLANFCQLIMVPLMFSMIPDTVDYGLRKNGQGNMAMSFSGHLLTIKMGLAIGGAATGWILNGYGYVPNVEQTDEALLGIRMIFALAAVALGVLMLGIMSFYRLSNVYMASIHQESNEPKTLPTTASS